MGLRSSLLLVLFFFCFFAPLCSFSCVAVDCAQMVATCPHGTATVPTSVSNTVVGGWFLDGNPNDYACSRVCCDAGANGGPACCICTFPAHQHTRRPLLTNTDITHTMDACPTSLHVEQRHLWNRRVRRWRCVLQPRVTLCSHCERCWHSSNKARRTLSGACCSCSCTVPAPSLPRGRGCCWNRTACSCATSSWASTVQGLVH